MIMFLQHQNIHKTLILLVDLIEAGVFVIVKVVVVVCRLRYLSRVMQIISNLSTCSVLYFNYDVIAYTIT